MITLQEVERRLADAGLRNRYWGKPEVRELQHVILPDETVAHALLGRYEGGTALLVATDRRLLLVDKKPMFLNLQDVRYDTVAEVDYYARLIDATVVIRTINKLLRFTSFRQANLRKLVSSVQEQVMELRQQGVPQTHPVMTYSQDPTTGEVTPVVNYQQVQNFQNPVGFPNPQVTIRRRVSRFYPIGQ